MTRKFGWCLDGNHDVCRHQYLDWNHKLVTCGCECHGGDK